MKKKYFIILAFLGAWILYLPVTVSAQKEKMITVSSVIVDDQGNPLMGAVVFSGGSLAKTNDAGKFTIQMEAASKLIVEAKGYERKVLSVDDAMNAAKIDLKAIPFKYGEDEKVDIAFRRVYEGDVVGAIGKLNMTEADRYGKFRTANDALTGRIAGLLGSNTIRGLGIGINVADITGSGLSSGNALFIVDGLPRDIESLRETEIEDITVLKDVNAAILYGSAAVNGVILITTKRGEAFKNKADFQAMYSISTPRILPKYLNSADYMTLYNQARANDGLTPQYTDQMIDNYRNGNKYRYPDVDYYSDEYLKPMSTSFDLMSEFSGGNDVAKYYANIGWFSSGDILNFGEGANARNNVFNIRANVDLRINNWINTSIDGYSLFGSDKGQRGNFWTAAATNRPNEFTPLLPFDLIDPENSLLTGRKNDVEGKYLLGGNVNYLTNAIADGYSAGILEQISRKFTFNNRIYFDLNKLMEGLTFHTNISFDYVTSYDQTIENQYSVYQPFWNATEDKIDSLVQHGQDARPGTQVVGNVTFQRRFGFYGLFSYDRTFSEVHHVTGSLLGYGCNFKEQADFQGLKQAHLGLQLGYSLNRKYMVDFSSAFVNSVKLPEGNKLGFSPSLGLAWVISSEDFLASSGNIDYLKFRLSAGIMNSDLPIGGFFYYDNRYTTSGSYAWFEGGRSRSGVVSSWTDNPDLGFAKRNEVNVGIEGLFFDRFLGIEANLFYDVYNDLVIRPTAQYPNYYTSFTPYENYNAERYQGAEIGVNLNKTAGNWIFNLGFNALYVTSERTKVDEIYNNDYQYRKGRPVDATFGLEALRLFQDQADIDNSPKQLFGSVKPGDIKYKDQNGDGFIDSNDEVYLRRFQAPLSGGLHLLVSYRNMTFYALGEGRAGSETFKESSYYWIDGNDKYSEVVRGAWTDETKNTATFPRLTTQTSSNNYRRSSYWLYNNDYFQLRKVQLTWGLPESVSRSMLMKNLDLFITTYNLFQFAKYRDIREMSIGSSPSTRSITLGLKASF